MDQNNSAHAAQKDWDAAVSAANLAPATGHIVLDAATVLNIAALLSKLRAPVADIYVEARECGVCGHVGINDSSDTLAACKNCDWSGASPKEDHCPGCAQNGTMTAACPECGGQYGLLADRTISAALASAPVADERAALQKLVDLEDMRLRLKALHEKGHGTDYDYYHKAMPAAWEAARAALASAPIPKPWPAEEQPDGTVTPVDPADMASAPVAGEAIGYSTGIHWRPRQSEQTIKLTRTAQPEYGFVHALYAAPQARECECSRKSKAVSDSEAQL